MHMEMFAFLFCFHKSYCFDIDLHRETFPLKIFFSYMYVMCGFMCTCMKMPMEVWGTPGADVVMGASLPSVVLGTQLSAEKQESL